MALARTSPKPKKKATSRIPRQWPAEGSRVFRSLPDEEKAWLLSSQDWYIKSGRLGAPSCMVRDPTFEPLRQNPEYHLPYLVKYWRVCPMIFSVALRTLTGYRPNQPTVAATHRAWKLWLKSHQQALTRAAE